MSTSPLTPNEALSRAAKLARAGNAEDAKLLLHQVLEREPANKKAKKALKSLQADQQAPLTAADFDRVTQLMTKGRVDAAVREARRLCKNHPGQPALQNLRGVALSHSGDRDSALEAFGVALELEPTYSEALSNYASTLTALNRFKEALPYYQELVSRGHADAAAFLSLARALRGDGQLANAVKALQRALSMQPAYPDAFNLLGIVLGEEGEVERAVESYENALAIEPSHRRALLNLGQLYSEHQQFEAAINVYERLMGHYPDDINGLRGMGSAMLFAGRQADADDYFRRVLEQNPHDAVAAHLRSAAAGETPETGSAAYAQAVFDGYARNFEKALTETLDYRFPESLPARLEALDGKDAWYEQALDLGCGTGLVGAQIRTYCAQLTGVDVSSEMITRAEEKAVYDELRVEDVITMLHGSDANWNLVIAADLLNYLGGLESFFVALANRCATGARVILTTERAEVDRFALKPSGRYVHDDKYLSHAIGDSFQISQRDTIVLRREGGQPVEGSVFTLTRL
ncbi:MAG: tetratricopeptide repeat protein [Pseudomonadota bacterium]